ncbi:MAG: ABC transporter substrate-binding protein [Chloroflexota bacterium]|nr:ABC transporter substrate-binding protein [Chloroflexota bacterium]MBI5704176.1 ABC transporter substrate-binding protein [Chloroflexota bacterium]
MKLTVKFVVLLTIAALALSACGALGQSQPVVMRIGWAGSPDTLNPGAAVLTEAYTIFALVYDAMYQLQLDGTFKLNLAESVSVSDDGLVYTYKIRDGVKFHDGQPLTAEDVVFSYLLYQNTEGYPWMGNYTTYFEKIEATPNNEVVITLSEPIPNIDAQLVFLYVLPKHIWENEDPLEFENVAAVGSGPFKMVEYKPNEFVHLAKNPDYFGGAPKVDEVIFQTFESQDALVQAIKTGQVDMITEMPATAVETLKQDPNIEVVTGAPFAPSVTDVIINQVLPENCPPEDGLCTGHPALLDRNVRLALAHATDKQKIIDVVLLGYGTPGTTLIPDGLGIWYNSSIKDYPYDVAKANQILDDAGYKDVNGDGIRETPDGSRSLTFRINWPSDSIDSPRLAELLSEMWGQVGVKLEAQALDPDTLTSVCCPAFDFDIIIWGWGSDPDPNLLLSVMTTDEIPTGSSETGYSNPEYDDLYRQQASELNLEKRRALVWKMQEIVFNDVVYIIPYYEQNVQAFRKDRFTGFILDQPKVELSDVTSLIRVEPVR